MTWIDKELQKRAAESKTSALDSASAAEPVPVSARMSNLWSKLQGLNRSLPDEIQLQSDTSRTVLTSPEEATVLEWLLAPNGAAVGFTGNAVRYVWPHKPQRKSKNFWLRWSVQQGCYIVNQRVDAAVPPAIAEYRFDETKSDYLLKCLVVGKCVKPRLLTQRRFWFF